jgi:hypothetical protein
MLNDCLHQRPGEVCIKAVTARDDDKLATIGGIDGSIDPLQVGKGFLDAREGENVVILPGNDHDRPGGEEAEEVGHLSILVEAGNVVIGTVINGEQRSLESTEGAGGHGEGKAGEKGGSVNADRAAAGVAHHADTFRIHIRAGEEVVDGAVNIENTLTEQGLAEEESMHGGVMATVLGDLCLEPLAALTEGALLDAQGGNAMAQAAQGKVSVAFDLDGESLVFSIYGEGDVHAGSVTLQADHKRIGRGDSMGETEVSGDVGKRLTGEEELFDMAERVLTLPEGAHVQGRAILGKTTQELHELLSQARLPGEGISAAIGERRLGLVHEMVVVS